MPRRYTAAHSPQYYPSDELARSHHGPNDAETHNSNRVSEGPYPTYEIADMPLVMGTRPPRPDPNLPDGTQWGDHSFFVPRGSDYYCRGRYIPTASMRHIQGFKKTQPIEGDLVEVDSEQWNTEVGWARQWLKQLGKRPGRKSWFTLYANAKRPFWYVPSRIPEAVYVDIKAAYPSVYERTSWTVDYVRGHRISRENDLLYWPFEYDWKLGRSFIVTVAQGLSQRRVMLGGKLHSDERGYNPYINLPFYAFVMDVLSAIALFVIPAYDAIYYNCDGAIIPSQHTESYTSFCSSLGITTTIKARGEAHVTNSGFWRVGSRATIPYRRTQGERLDAGYLPLPRPKMEHMTMDEAVWVLRKFESLPPRKRGQ